MDSLLGQVDMAEDIEQKVIEIVSEQMGVDKSEVTRETHFINDLNADSLDTVELVMEFEDEFELSIPDEEAEKIQTVGQAIDYIKEHSGKIDVRSTPGKGTSFHVEFPAVRKSVHV